MIYTSVSRRFTVKKILFLFISALLLAVTGCRNEAPVPHEGASAPDFNLESISGNKVRMSEMRGKVVLLNFWASWCSPCREEIPSLISLNAALTGKNFQLLAVAIDEGGRDAVMQFFSRTRVSLPTLFDPGGLAGRRYGIRGVPETFVIDKHGIIRKKVVGPIDWTDPEMIGYINKLAKSE
jgi:thiol-disulfide isomerase/thioredoxin